MKAILQSEYAKYFLWALLINIVAAWFSIGYHHPDEHFQILEFANYKLGNIAPTDLPWEFADKIRPGLQPFIAYCFIAVSNSIGISNPFIITFLLRLFMGTLGWFIVCKLVLLLLPDFSTEKGKKIFIGLCLFLWFVPYLNVRFSSENTATISFLWALYFILKVHATNFQKGASFFILGVLITLSFFFRFQMAFAIVGLAVWLLFIKKISWQNWLAVLFSGLVTSILCVYIDKWLYGTWECTPYNYYLANVVKHVAANFGVGPWWYYVVLFFNMAIPPLSLVLLYFCSMGVYKKRVHLFSFILISFTLAHSVIGHKEMRFLFPVWFLFVYLVAVGADFCISTYKFKKIYAVGFYLLLVLNIGALLYRTIAPAQEAIPCFVYANKHFKDRVTMVCIGEPLFSLAGLKANFYKPKNIDERIVKDESELSSFLTSTNPDSVIVFKKTAELTGNFANYTSKRIYCMFPEWVLKFNINNWQDRANIWSIHVLHKRSVKLQ